MVEPKKNYQELGCDEMGLWDELEEEEADVGGRNKYLEDPSEGLLLVAKLLSGDSMDRNERRVLRDLDYLLDHKLLKTSDEINLSNELIHYKKLQVLSDKLYQQNKVNLLQGKSVVGIGGKFSAGKSKFINAIIGGDILPEDQTPTTSIATYIVAGMEEEIRAYTFSNGDIILDEEAAKALTHAFHAKYGLGFSSFISNLVMKVPTFLHEEIVILDTPGYSKFDQGIKKSITDAEKAFQQLKSVDDLIWLVDIENGVIQNQDIEFIKSLQLENPILVVFNKADKKTPGAIEEIITTSKEILMEAQIPVFDVLAYSALEKKEYTREGMLNEYLQKVNHREKVRDYIRGEIIEISSDILSEMEAQKKRFEEERNFLGDVIFRSMNVLELKSLVSLYGKSNQYLTEMQNMEKYVRRTSDKILKILEDLQPMGGKQ